MLGISRRPEAGDDGADVANLISTEGVRGMEWSKWSAETEPGS